MAITIAVETDLSDNAHRSVADLNETPLNLTPGDLCHHLVVEQVRPKVRFVAAREESGVVTIGARALAQTRARLTPETGDNFAIAVGPCGFDIFISYSPVLDYSSTTTDFYGKSVGGRSMRA